MCRESAAAEAVAFMMAVLELLALGLEIVEGLASNCTMLCMLVMRV